MERLELTDVRSRVAKGQQVDGGERFGVTLVEVQSVNHGRAFEHDSHTRMAVAVDAAFVAFTDGRFRLRAHGTMIAARRSDLQANAVTGSGGIESDHAPRAAQPDSSRAVGSSGKRARLALPPDFHPLLYQCGR